MLNFVMWTLFYILNLYLILDWSNQAYYNTWYAQAKINTLLILGPNDGKF